MKISPKNTIHQISKNSKLKSFIKESKDFAGFMGICSIPALFLTGFTAAAALVAYPILKEHQYQLQQEQGNLNTSTMPTKNTRQIHVSELNSGVKDTITKIHSFNAIEAAKKVAKAR